MPRRKPPAIGHGFNLATVAQIGLIPLITVGVGLAGFYYITKDTLSRHEIAITSTLPSEIKAEQDAREKTRNEFLDKLSKLNEGVSTLNTNVALQTQRNDQIVDTLKQIRDQITTVKR